MIGVLEMSCKNHQCAMCGSNTPVNYQLVKKPDSELVLQGYFTWHCDQCGVSGGEWQDLPTIVMPAAEKITRWKKFRQSVNKLFSNFKSDN